MYVQRPKSTDECASKHYRNWQDIEQYIRDNIQNIWNVNDKRISSESSFIYHLSTKLN